MKVADLTVEEFRALVREVVYEVLDDYQGEDDDGELRPEFIEELERRIAEGGPTYSEAEVRRELGL